MSKYIFQDFMFVNGKLYTKTEEDAGESISEEMDNALTQLGMYESWEEVTGPITVIRHDGRYTFSRDELINIVKVFGVEQ